jgi:hypothetical protein
MCERFSQKSDQVAREAAKAQPRRTRREAMVAAGGGVAGLLAARSLARPEPASATHLGFVQLGHDNNAGSNPPTQTILRAQSGDQTTLEVRNEETELRPAGGGLTVIGGPFAVRATGGVGTDLPEGVGLGVHGTADNGTGVVGEGRTGVFGNSLRDGNGVWGRSHSGTGVLGEAIASRGVGVRGRGRVGVFASTSEPVSTSDRGVGLRAESRLGLAIDAWGPLQVGRRPGAPLNVPSVSFRADRTAPVGFGGWGKTAILVQTNSFGKRRLQRVSVGEADSGGTGFRVLRVPN